MYLSDSGQTPGADFCQHGNEPSGQELGTWWGDIAWISPCPSPHYIFFPVRENVSRVLKILCYFYVLGKKIKLEIALVISFLQEELNMQFGVLTCGRIFEYSKAFSLAGVTSLKL